MTTLYTVTVDTEEEWDWNSGWPTRSPSLANIERLPAFQELCSRYGVATTYFANLAVLEDDKARDTLLRLSQQPRVEVGMHIHPWNTPPIQTGHVVSERESFLHNLPTDLQVAKLETVLNAFVNYGLRPTSFRGGRYSSGGGIHEFLRNHGFLADSSIVPYTTWKASPGAPDFRTRGLEPQRLAPRFPSDRAFWEIPLTKGFNRRTAHAIQKVFDVLEDTPLKHLRMIGLAGKTGIARKLELSFEKQVGDRIPAFLQQLRKYQLPSICFSMHSSSLMPAGSPYSRNLADVARLFQRAESAFRLVSQWPEFQSVTMTEVAERLDLGWTTPHGTRITL